MMEKDEKILRISKDDVLNHPSLCYFKPIEFHDGQITLTAFNVSGEVIDDNIVAQNMEEARNLARMQGLVPMTLH